jgi:hypothetical protein
MIYARVELTTAESDDGRKTLKTSSSLDCSYDVETLIGARTYLFRQYVRDAERVR